MSTPDVKPLIIPEYSDIQGLILKGYTHQYSVHMLYNFGSADAAGAFFRPLIPLLRPATHWLTRPEMMLNIGLTWNGIAKVDPTLNAGSFPGEFVKGPAHQDPQSMLGDIGTPGDPSTWWSKRFTTDDIHCVVHAYALDKDKMEKLVAIISDAAAAAGVTELKPMANASGRIEQCTDLPKDFVHFGYKDSINQPELDTDPDPEPGKSSPQALLNFLIGYSKKGMPGPKNGAEGKFARNGCYNAFRVLYQDVVEFEQFLHNQSENIAHRLGKSKEYAREWLAAKMNGRWRNGSPLESSPTMPDPDTADERNVSYLGDDTGLKCPIAGHTRVANPRDQPMEQPPRPHLIRRGVPYGAPLNEHNKDEDRGLVGMFLCGNLAGQFQRICGWINSIDFTPLQSYPPPQDALIANRAIPGPNVTQTTSFTIPMADGGGPPLVIEKMPTFVVTRGTAYFLLPSISTLKKIAGIT